MDGVEDFTVDIADEMRALWRASRRGNRSPATAPAEPAPAPTPAPARRANPPERQPAPPAPRLHERIVLRRDGARPLVFDGLPLLGHRREDPDSGAAFALSLYLAADGRAVAQLALHPLDPLTAQPVHGVAVIDTAADLGRLIDQFDPSAALPCPLGMDEAHAAAVQARAAGLVAGFARFRAALQGADGATNPLWRTS